MALITPAATAAPPAATAARGAAWAERAELAAVLAIVALAAALRLFGLSYAEYRGDDVDMVNAAYAALQHGWLQSHGLISSIPVDNGPVAMWLLMLPLALTGSLLAAHVWVALLNVASVALCFGFVRTTWNRRLAVVATLLYAVSPWAVVYSRRLWITAFDAPLALLAFWSLFAWFRVAATRKAAADGAITKPRAAAPTEVGRRRISRRRAPSPRRPLGGASSAAAPVAAPAGWYAVALGGYLPPLLCGLAFSAFFQAHVVPMGEGVTLLLALLGGLAVLGVRRVLVALATLALTMAPYVLTTVLPALGKTLAGQQAHHLTVDGLSWYYFGHLVTGLGYQSIAPEGSRLLDATGPLFSTLDILAVGFLALGVAVTLLSAVTALRQRAAFPAARAAVLLLWALIPPLGLMPHLVEVHPYYFVVSMPAIYILEGVGLLMAAKSLGALLGSYIRRAGPRLRRDLPAVLLTGVLVAAQLALAVPFFRVLPEYWSAGDYGYPLRDTEALAAKAAALGAGTLTVVGGYDHDLDYTLYSTLQREDAGARYADDRGIFEYAASGPPLLYLTTDDQAWEAQLLRAAFPTSQLAAVTLSGQGRTFRFFRPATADVQAWARRAAPPLPSPLTFGAAARLDGARVEGAAPGSAAHVWLDWRLLRDPSEPLLMRLELVGGDGYVWTTNDAVSYPAGYWQAGDAGRVAFLNRLDLPLPAYLPPGQYTVRVRLLGIADGKQVGDAASVGGLAVAQPAAAGVAAPALPHASRLAVAPGLTLAGWQLDSAQVEQHQTTGLVLYWRVTGPVAAVPRVALRDAAGASLATDSSELSAALPPARWPVGALLADRHLLAVDGRATPGPATVTLIAPDGSATALGPLTIAALPRQLTLPPIPRGLAVTFGPAIRLAGFGLSPSQGTAGARVQLTLYWQATGRPALAETAFVHLVDGSGKLVAQADGPPGGTAMPTSIWEPGQVVVDTHTLTLPPGLPPGIYHLHVGLYNLASGARLTASGPDLAPGADDVDLGPVTIGGRPLS